MLARFVELLHGTGKAPVGVARRSTVAGETDRHHGHRGGGIQALRARHAGPATLLISQYDPELGEVTAFEELIGSHGGLGGPQSQPFVLHPTDWELHEPVPIGAPAIYRNRRRWIESLGIAPGSAG